MTVTRKASSSAAVAAPGPEAEAGLREEEEEAAAAAAVVAPTTPFAPPSTGGLCICVCKVEIDLTGGREATYYLLLTACSSFSFSSVPWELLPEERVPGVTVVRDRKGAQRALQALYEHRDAYFACDTEVRGWLVGNMGMGWGWLVGNMGMGLDAVSRPGRSAPRPKRNHTLIHPPTLPPQVADLNIKTEGPVGNGKVICFSVYGGPDVDFGQGKGTVRGCSSVCLCVYLSVGGRVSPCFLAPSLATGRRSMSR